MNKNQELTELMIGLFPLLDRLFVKPFENIARSAVTNTQLRVLFILNRSGKITMTELARQMDISKQQITAVIDGLVQMGFVERILNPEDRRKIEIEISQNALDFIHKIKMKMGEVLSGHYALLSPDETEVLWKDVKEIEGLIHKMLDE